MLADLATGGIGHPMLCCEDGNVIGNQEIFISSYNSCLTLIISLEIIIKAKTKQNSFVVDDKVLG